MAKLVIVTGASSGIGKKTVMRLLESGYQVIGLARRFDKLAAEQLQPSHKIESNGSYKPTYVPLEFDIAKPKVFTEVIDRIVSITDGSEIYGLVNNAGYLEPGAIEDLTMTNLRDQFETNFFGHVDFTKRVLALMVERNQSGGRIINVSSFAGLISLPLIGAYAASKHALEAVFDALRVELWNTDIKVITINPGVINTGIYDILKHKTEDILNIKNVNKTRFVVAYNRYLLNSDYYTGLNPISVANVILKAVSSLKPHHRYLVGSRKEILMIRLLPYIPEKLLFTLLANRIHSRT